MSMDEKQANLLARALGGEAWHSGGGIWLVRLVVGEKLVVFSGDCVCEYESEEAFDEGRASNRIDLYSTAAVSASIMARLHPDAPWGPCIVRTGDNAEPAEDGEERWVIVDQTGAVMYEDNKHKLGWASEYEARQAARGLESRGAVRAERSEAEPEVNARDAAACQPTW